MLQAELHGKLSNNRPETIHDRLEDILTSNVFGALRYLPPEKGLLAFLMTARNRRGERIQVIPQFETVEWWFWPRLRNGTEPDLLLILRSPRATQYLLIEAKYRAGKHGRHVAGSTEEGQDSRDPATREDESTSQEGTKDQLAKYLLTFRSELDQPDSGWRRDQRVHSHCLVYVTQHLVMPLQDLEESARFLVTKESRLMDRVYWTHWGEALRVFKSLRPATLPPWETFLIEDMCQLLGEKKRFLYFDGIRPPANLREFPETSPRLWRESFIWHRSPIPCVPSPPTVSGEPTHLQPLEGTRCHALPCLFDHRYVWTRGKLPEGIAHLPLLWRGGQ